MHRLLATAKTVQQWLVSGELGAGNARNVSARRRYKECVSAPRRSFYTHNYGNPSRKFVVNGHTTATRLRLRRTSQRRLSSRHTIDDPSYSTGRGGEVVMIIRPFLSLL